MTPEEPKPTGYISPGWETLARIVVAQSEKSQWKDQPPLDVVKYIQAEAAELTEAVEHAEDQWHIGSEIADVLYLTIRAAHALGIDPLKALQMKTVRNAMKYPMDKEGSYDEYSAKSRQDWKMIGDEQFFEWWEKAIGDLSYDGESNKT